jgi:hypothetical protein
MDMIELIWKEHLEGVRRKQYIAIGILLIGFALLSPVMTKALPFLLESQTGNEELAAAIPVNLRESMRSFFKSIHQIGTLLLVYLGASQVAYERNERLVFPIHAGIEIQSLIQAKALVYGFAIFGVTTMATVASAVYGDLLIPGSWKFSQAIWLIGLEVSGYLFFAYLVGMLAGSWIRNKMLAMGLGSLFLFVLAWMSGFTAFQWMLPTYLLAEANLLIGYWTKPLLGCFLMTAAWSGLIMEAVGWKLNRTNMTEGEGS